MKDLKDLYTITYQITDKGKEYPPRTKEIPVKNRMVEDTLLKDLKKWRSAEGWSLKFEVKIITFYQSGYSN